MSQHLFRLIDSLDKNEKRYFRLHAGMQSGDKNYLKLFDAIDKEGLRDEAALKERFADEAFARQLGVTKNYLYRQLLKSLESAQSEQDPELKARSLLKQASILFEKALFDQAKKQLRKAKKIAEEQQAYHILLEALRFETKISPGSARDEIIARQGHLLAQLQHLNTIRRFSNRIFAWFLAHGFPQNESEREEFRQLREEFPDEIPPGIETLRSRFETAGFLGHYHTFLSEWETALIHRKEQLEVLESAPRYLERQVSLYVNLIHNALVCCLKTDHLRDFHIYYGKLIHLPYHKTSRIRERDWITIRRSRHEMLVNFCLVSCHFPPVEAALPAIKAWIDSDGEKIDASNIITLCLNISHLCMMAGKLSEALRWINRLLNDFRPDQRTDLYSAALVINLLIHFELGNLDLVQHFARSAYRFFLSKGRLQKVEQDLLDFIRDEMPGIRNEKALDKAFERLHSRITKHAQERDESQLLEVFDLQSWLKARIEKRSYLQVALERSRRDYPSRDKAVETMEVFF